MTPPRLIILPLVVMAMGRVAAPATADACQIAIAPFILDEGADGSDDELSEAPRILQARLLGRTHGSDSCTGVIRLEVHLAPAVADDEQQLGVELELEGLRDIHPEPMFLPFEGTVRAVGRREFAATEIRARFVDRSGVRSALSDPVLVDDEVDDGLGGCSVAAGTSSHAAWLLVMAAIGLRGRRPANRASS